MLVLLQPLVLPPYFPPSALVPLLQLPRLLLLATAMTTRTFAFGTVGCATAAVETGLLLLAVLFSACQQYQPTVILRLVLDLVVVVVWLWWVVVSTATVATGCGDSDGAGC